MALFRKKPANETNGEEGDGETVFEPQPDKARKWFAHARTSADSFNYAYALECYANGIKLDPGPLEAHVSMLEAAIQYGNKGNKPATSKEIRSLDDGTPIGRFAAAEFEWMKDIRSAKPALKALEAAVKAEQFEWGRWISPRVLKLVVNNKKVSKSSLLQAMELFREIGAWDESLTAGEKARDLDPSDNDLASELKNLAAQRAMDQGGYDESVGEEGGYRKFIRDSDRQQELIEEEALSGGESVEERNLERARLAYEAAPTLADAINRYAQLLKRKGTFESEQRARDIFLQGFEATGEYRFRMNAGDVEIEQQERAVRALDEKLESDPDNAQLREERDRVNHALLELMEREYQERVKRYPTDRVRRFELGEVEYELGNYQEAMAHFQAAKDEPKYRVRAQHMLGRSFLAEGWYSEAVSEFEEALRAIDATERDREQPIRYDLMLALIESAREEQSVDLARQAKSICSEIARKDITYRDIRAKRGEVDEVIKQISGG